MDKNGVPPSHAPLGPVPGGPVVGQPQMMGQPQGFLGAAVPGQQVVQWMDKPESMFGCPEGLEYLTQVDQLIIAQQMELMEIVTSFETPNRFVIKNSLGQQIYYAFEESSFCMRQCCGPNRGFIIHVVDNLNNEVMRMSREFKCCAGCPCCIPCCQHCAFEVVVESPPGTPIGYVTQSASYWNPKLQIRSGHREPILDIEGPCCPCQCVCGCTADINFRVKSLGSENEVGNISKQWGGWLKETYAKADTFGLAFPLDLDVKAKATLIGAVLLIDFMFYEQKKNNNH